MIRMQRVLSAIASLFMFWLPLALALLMLVLAVRKGDIGMGVLAVVIALIAGLRRIVSAGAAARDGNGGEA